VFLLRIAQFTEWPTKPEQRVFGPFVIGVLGEDPFGTFLDLAVAGERIDGRAVIVRRFADPQSLGDCDLLFVARSQQRAVDAILSRLEGRPTLTVADFDGFVDGGGIVEMFVEQDRVRFRIGRAAARAAGLNMRSQLLRAAAAVH
jgi:YfiR/HmsC-like